MMAVRRATIDDVPWLVEQAKTFEETEGHKYPIFKSRAHARRVFEGLVMNEVVLIAEEGAERLGFLVAYGVRHPLNSDIRVLEMALWWVPISARKTPAAGGLLREFENIGREQADWIVAGMSHDTPARRARMERSGFRPVERVYLLEV